MAAENKNKSDFKCNLDKGGEYFADACCGEDFLFTLLSCYWGRLIWSYGHSDIGGRNMGRGIFGALLDNPVGKGVAILFMLYLCISCFALFSLGLFAYIFKEEEK